MNALHDPHLRPASIDDATRARSPAERAAPLAGGTDLLPNLRRGWARCAPLVDLTAVAGSTRSPQADGSLRVGATTTLAALARARRGAPAGPRCHNRRAVAGTDHREAATLGGNLCRGHALRVLQPERLVALPAMAIA